MLSERDHSHEPLILCRHPLEAMLVTQAGFEAIAIMGESTSDKQVELLCRCVEKGNKLTLFISCKDHHAVDIMSPLLRDFYIRLARFKPQSDRLIGLKAEEIQSLLVL